ncbi:hypothetical protein NDU88_005450 [Pleurodeles waltl]|uniref:Uncharacterized protein n=1 Tax=Pleurodeles waltl TaxID=8319 RepID=A0AAV7L1A6_PLEWA|nr:hypothetical protein NDU88_005450 [Pleurodeles waltl]
MGPQDGSKKMGLQDGSKWQGPQDGGKQMESQDGGKQILPQDGSRQTEPQDGSKEMVSQDGDKQMVSQDGGKQLVPQDRSMWLGLQVGGKRLVPQDGGKEMGLRDGIKQIGPQDGGKKLGLEDGSKQPVLGECQGLCCHGSAGLGLSLRSELAAADSVDVRCTRRALGAPRIDRAAAQPCLRQLRVTCKGARACVQCRGPRSPQSRKLTEQVLQVTVQETRDPQPEGALEPHASKNRGCWCPELGSKIQ